MRLIEPCKSGDILEADRFGRVCLPKARPYNGRFLHKVARWFWKRCLIGVATKDMETGENPWRNTMVFHGGMRHRLSVIADEPSVNFSGYTFTNETSNPVFVISTEPKEGHSWIRVEGSK